MKLILCQQVLVSNIFAWIKKAIVTSCIFLSLCLLQNISGQVLSNILFNSCDLLRVDLVGVQILVPYILSALELVLSDLNPKFK